MARADLAGALGRSGTADHVLIKSHGADAMSLAMARHGGMRTICTVRRIEDAAASWLQAFDWSEANTVEYRRAWPRMFAELRDHALVLRYDLLDLEPRRAALRIARHLDPRARRAEIRRIVARHTKSAVIDSVGQMQSDGPGVTDIGFSFYNRNTFFHRRHVASFRSKPAEERLPLKQILRIRQALAAEIDAAGLGSGPGR